MPDNRVTPYTLYRYDCPHCGSVIDMDDGDWKHGDEVDCPDCGHTVVLVE